MAIEIQSLRIAFEPVQSLDYSSIDSGYTAVGGPIANAARQFFIQNLTDALLMFSFDGVNDHFPLPSEGFFLDDITTNKVQSQGFYLSANTVLYVRTIDSPSIGSVYFSVSYGV